MQNESKLTPFDAELIAMITDVTGEKPEVQEKTTGFIITVKITDKFMLLPLQQAVKGRLGHRVLAADEMVNPENPIDRLYSFFIAYSFDENLYPAVYGDNSVNEENPNLGIDYVLRSARNVKAVQVKRGAIEKAIHFVGSGTFSIPRTMNAKGTFTFATPNGTLIDVPEDYFIVRDADGRYSAYEPVAFTRMFTSDTIAKRHTEIINRFTELFGDNLATRTRKLEEEFTEFREASLAACPEYADCTKMAHMIDELADMYAVLFHISGIIGIYPDDLLEMAYDKVVGRIKDPNYKRNV